MSTPNNKLRLQVAGLGMVAGMRAAMAPAVVSHFLSRHPNKHIAHSHLKFVQSPVTAIATKIFSAIELAGDKLPSTGNRTAFPQVLGRIASGAFVGVSLYKANKQNLLEGAIIGGATALAATFAFFYLRKYADKLPHVKDALTGTVEDILAIGSGIALAK